MDIKIEDFFGDDCSRAYLVGISNYKNVRSLDTPINDCKALQNVLTSKHNFRVSLAVDTTKQELETLLNAIEKDCKQGESKRIVFYFAGHGIVNGADETNQRPKGYLVMSDSELGMEKTYMEMGEVLKRLDGLPNCHHLLVVLDCCYAGAIKYAIETRSLGFTVPKTLYKEKFNYYVDNPARQVITSAANDQEAVDSFGNRGKNENHRSPFAESLIDALENGDRSWSFGNVKPDGIITASELGFYLSQGMSAQLTRKNIPFALQQTPSVFPLNSNGKGEFIFVESVKKLALPENPNQNPFKGLRSYEQTDNDLFYGRERVLEGWWEGSVYKYGLLPLIEKGSNGGVNTAAESAQQAEQTNAGHKNEAPTTYYRILVTGRSGIGKSSLVKAGVIARLKQAKKETVIITPGPTPFTTYKDRLDEIEHSTELHYLLVDQYEELVTQCNDQNEREGFEKKIAALADDKKAVVIITLRSDIERQLRDGAFLQGESEKKVYRFLVPNFSRDEIKEIVVQPASQNLLEFKGLKEAGKSEDETNNAFIEKMVDEAYAYPDSLPMLSEALSRLYEERDGVQLKEEIYKDFGGIHGILSAKVKDVYDSLDALQKNLFRPFIFRMISFDTGYLAKRRVFTFLKQDGIPINELEFSDSAINDAVNAIKDKLIEARLVSSKSNDPSANEETYIDPAHDALVNDSDRIAKWQKESNATSPSGTTSVIAFQSRISTLTALANAARNYAFSNEKNKKGLLWKSDPRLGIVQQMVAQKELVLNKIEETFVRDSHKAKVRGRYIERAVFVTIVVLIAIAAGISWFKNKEVNKQKDNVQNELAISYLGNSERGFEDSNQLGSLLLLAKAVETSKDTALIHMMEQKLALYDHSFLLSGVVPSESSIRSTRLSPNTKFIAVLNDSLEVWDLESLKLVFHQSKTANDVYFDEPHSSIYLLRDSVIECRNLLTNEKLHDIIFPSSHITIVKWSLEMNKIILSEGGNLRELDTSLKEIKNYGSSYGESVSPDFNQVAYLYGGDNRKEFIRVARLSPPFSAIMIDSIASDESVADYSFDSSSTFFFYVTFKKIRGHNSLTAWLAFITIRNLKAGTFSKTSIRMGKGDSAPQLVSNNGEIFLIQGEHAFPVIKKNEAYVLGKVLHTQELLGLNEECSKEFGCFRTNDAGMIERTTLQGSRIGLPLLIDTRASNSIEQTDSFHYFYKLNPKVQKNALVIAGKNAVYIYKSIDKDVAILPATRYCALSENGQFALIVDSAGRISIRDNVKKRSTAFHFLFEGSATLEALQAMVSNDGTAAVISNQDSAYILNFLKHKIIGYKRNYYEGLAGDSAYDPAYAELNVFNTTGYSFINETNKIVYASSDGFVYAYDPALDRVFYKRKLPGDLDALPVHFSKDGKYCWLFNRSQDDGPSFKRISFLANEQDLTLPADYEVRKAVTVGDTSIIYLLVLDDNWRLYKTHSAKPEPLPFPMRNVIDGIQASNDNKFLLVATQNANDESEAYIYRTDSWEQTLVFPFLKKGEIADSFQNQQYTIPMSFFASLKGEQFFLFGAGKVMLIDTISKRPFVLHAQNGVPANKASSMTSSFYNGDIRIFDGSALKTYGIDDDLPSALFKLQIEATTGTRLNETTNKPMAIAFKDLLPIWKQYSKEAAEHLKICRHREYNLYRQLKGIPLN